MWTLETLVAIKSCNKLWDSEEILEIVAKEEAIKTLKKLIFLTPEMFTLKVPITFLVEN